MNSSDTLPRPTAMVPAISIAVLSVIVLVGWAAGGFRADSIGTYSLWLIPAVLILIPLSVWLLRETRSLCGRLRLVGEAMKCLSEGDLSARVEDEGQGGLCDVFNAMARKLEKQVRGRGKLVEIIKTVNQAATIEEGFEQLLAGAKEITRARYAALSIFGADGKIETFITLGLSEEEKRRIGRYPEGKGLLGHLQRHRETLRLRDMSKHPSAVGFPQGHPSMKSLLAAPILYGDQALGNIYLTDSLDGEFDEDDEYLIDQLAQLAAITIVGKRSRQQIVTVKERLERETVRLGEALKALAQGDLSVEVELDDRDDALSRLKINLAEMVRQLRDLIRQVVDVSTAVAGASDQIGSSAEQLAAGAQ